MTDQEIRTAILNVCKVASWDSDFNVVRFHALCDKLKKLGAADEREASFRAGFYAGFSYSGEGWNGEYPFQDKNRPIIGDQLVEVALTAALASRGDA